jgi:hypothetical protein
MIGNLKRMSKDEKAELIMNEILTGCIGEIVCCINPFDWLFCGPCIWGIYALLRNITLGIFAWPLVILDCCVTLFPKLLSETLGK